MNYPYRAAIVGLGNIALGYDGGLGKPPLTHVSALCQNKKVQVVAACSPVASERDAFCSLTGGAIYSVLDEMLDTERPELVSICSPTALHFEHALACVQAGVPMIWLEKPPVLVNDQGEILLKAVSIRGTKLMVGYQRRYAEPFVSLREMMKNHEKEKLFGITVNYSLKLYRNGCHGLDVVNFLLGNPDFVLEGVFGGPDCETPSFLLSAGSLPISFIGLATDFHCLDFILTFEQEQIIIANGGESVFSRSVIGDPDYLGCRCFGPLVEATEMRTLAENNGLADSLADLIASLEEQRQPVSTLESAMKSQRLMEIVIKESLR